MDKNKVKIILALETTGILCFGVLLDLVPKTTLKLLAVCTAVLWVMRSVWDYKNNTQLKNPIALYILAAVIFNYTIISELC